ncbi:MAG: transglutaminase domain-containing protein [Deltaproteobacteria bacterium]|nr:transglutaminase domain-containing protein [Deltaproteobacteria bacterium]MBN2670856.1 transglutaminase domain-containing protein [Deltaproteobacteria bacterium]
MSRLRRMTLIPALLICSFGLGILGNAWGEAFLLAVVSVMSALVPRRELDTYGQLIAILLWGGFVYLWFGMILPELVETQTTTLYLPGKMGVSFCIGVVSMRQPMKNALFTHTGDAMGLFFGVLFLGIGHGGAVYIGIVSTATVATLAGIWRAQVTPVRKREQSRQRWLTWVIVLSVASLVSAGLTLAIPRAYEWSVSRFVDSMSIRTSGFSPVLSLGALDHMLISSKVMFRVYTTRPKSQYLRGVVYNRYRSGHWSNGEEVTEQKIGTSKPGNPQNYGLHVIAAKPTERIFAPLDTSRVATFAPVTANQFAILTLPRGKDVEQYYIRSGMNALQSKPPTAEDTSVPPILRVRIQPLADSWVRGAADGRQTVDRIIHALTTQYRYSLSFSRKANADAVLDFLFRNKQGHCEYFASAYALVARTAGIPTRVVAGYQMKEYNAVGSYYMVRERHAHTWCESWVNGRWVTVDATPPGAADSAGSVSHWMDTAGVRISGLISWLAGLNRWVWPAAIAGLGVFWLLVRVFRRGVDALNELYRLDYRAPHALFVQLETALQRQLPREKHESLEHWAKRLARLPENQSEAISLLRAYAAWRYGNIGDVVDLAKRVEKWAKHSSR